MPVKFVLLLWLRHFREMKFWTHSLGGTARTSPGLDFCFCCNLLLESECHLLLGTFRDCQRQSLMLLVGSFFLYRTQNILLYSFVSMSLHHQSPRSCPWHTNGPQWMSAEYSFSGFKTWKILGLQNRWECLGFPGKGNLTLTCNPSSDENSLCWPL